MPEPCKQEAPISELRTNVLFFQEFMKRHEDREEKMVAYMQQVATQNEVLKSLHESISRHEKSIGVLFDMFRADHESKEREEQRRSLVTRIFMDEKWSMALLAIIALGAITDVICHWDLLAKIWSLFRG